jgi:hypothetical protein
MFHRDLSVEPARNLLNESKAIVGIKVLGPKSVKSSDARDSKLGLSTSRSVGDLDLYLWVN